MRDNSVSHNDINTIMIKGQVVEIKKSVAEADNILSNLEKLSEALKEVAKDHSDKFEIVEASKSKIDISVNFGVKKILFKKVDFSIPISFRLSKNDINIDQEIIGADLKYILSAKFIGDIDVWIQLVKGEDKNTSKLRLCLNGSNETILRELSKNEKVMETIDAVTNVLRDYLN